MPFRTCRRDQRFLLPPSLDQWIPDDHPVRFVLAFVEELDLAALGIETAPAELGCPAYPPRELLACWLYGFMDGRRSSRDLERACRECVPYLWLMGLLKPDHVTLWRFYDRHRQTMRGLFCSTVRVAVQAGLVDFALQCIDGTKIPVASNDRLRRRAALDKLMARVEAEIDAMEEQEGEDEPPSQRARRHRAMAKKEDLRARVQQAIAQVTAAEEHHGKKKPVALVSDPEARLMKTRHGWKCAYNAQAMVDSEEQLIVAADVTQDRNDSAQVVPLMRQLKDETGRYADVTVADNGYFSAANVEYARARTDLYVPDKSDAQSSKRAGDYHHSKFEYRPENDTFICPQGKPLTFVGHTSYRNRRGPGRRYQCHDCRACPVRDLCTSAKNGRSIKLMPYSAALKEHRTKMASDAARDLMKQRAPLVEAVFGIIKECQRASRFLMRGFEKVRQEWYLLCAAFNLRKLYKHWAQQMSIAD